MPYYELDVSQHLGPENKFVDKDFSHDQRSIGEEKMPETIDWLRPNKFFKDEYFIF